MNISEPNYRIRVEKFTEEKRIMLVPHSTRSRRRADISLSLSLSLFFDSRYGLRREGGTTHNLLHCIPWLVARSHDSVVYFSHLNKAAIRWFFARNSSLDLPGYQPCLRLMGAGKSARGNVQDPEQVFKAGIDRIADVVQKLCSNAF